MKKDRYERLHVMQRMEEEVERLWEVYGTNCSDQCLNTMKHVVKKLRNEVYACEVAKVDAKLQKGSITKKQARTDKANLKKRLC